MKTKEVKVNPLILKIEKGAKIGTVLRGYKGNSRTRGFTKLYFELGSTEYMLISDRDIVHIAYANKEAACIDVYMKDSANFKAASKKGFNPFGIPERYEIQRPSIFDIKLKTPPLIRFFPSAECAMGCIENIKKTSTYFSVQPGPRGGFLYYVNKKGKKELLACLTKCGYRGYLLSSIFTDALAELSGTANPSKDPEPIDIPEFNF